MTPVVKGLLIGCFVIVAIGVIVIVAIGFYVKQKAPEFIASGQAAQTEGNEYGRSVTESQCVTDALGRHRESPGLTAGITHAIWLEGCLTTSTVEESFCDGVPPEDAMMKSAEWRVRRCTELGFDQNAICREILGQVQGYCAGEVREAKVAPE